MGVKDEEEEDFEEEDSNRQLLLYDKYLPSNKATWIGQLGYLLNSQYNVRLREFVLPGSHDSAAKGNFEDCNCNWESWIPQCLPPYMRNRLAKNQEVSVWDQMKYHGIRFLDIRFEDVNYNGRQYPLHHSFYITSHPNNLAAAFSVVNDFLNENPTEFVVVAARTHGCGGLSSYSKSQIRNMLNGYSRLREFAAGDLDKLAGDIQGWGLVDIQDSEINEFYDRGTGCSIDACDETDDGKSHAICRCIFQKKSYPHPQQL